MNLQVNLEHSDLSLEGNLSTAVFAFANQLPLNTSARSDGQVPRSGKPKFLLSQTKITFRQTISKFNKVIFIIQDNCKSKPPQNISADVKKPVEMNFNKREQLHEPSV